MVSGKNAKKRRPTTPVNIRRTGLPWLTIGAVTAVLALTAGIFTVVLTKTNENTAAEQAAAVWQPSVDNPDPSTAIPGIYVGASTPATGDTAAGYIDYQAASHVTAD